MRAAIRHAVAASFTRISRPGVKDARTCINAGYGTTQAVSVHVPMGTETLDGMEAGRGRSYRLQVEELVNNLHQAEHTSEQAAVLGRAPLRMGIPR